ncbi:hypothetical protein BHE74_00030566 [Ensete ventricosum]|nr:hypothetical protein BHE74_00030566 [Ensete ventricosum]
MYWRPLHVAHRISIQNRSDARIPKPQPLPRRPAGPSTRAESNTCDGEVMKHDAWGPRNPLAAFAWDMDTLHVATHRVISLIHATFSSLFALPALISLGHSDTHLRCTPTP